MREMQKKYRYNKKDEINQEIINGTFSISL